MGWQIVGRVFIGIMILVIVIVDDAEKRYKNYDDRNTVNNKKQSAKRK